MLGKVVHEFCNDLGNGFTAIKVPNNPQRFFGHCFRDLRGSFDVDYVSE